MRPRGKGENYNESVREGGREEEAFSWQTVS